MDFKVYINSKDPNSPQVKKLQKKLSKFGTTVLSPKSTDWESWSSCVNSCPRDKFCLWIKDDSITTADAGQIYDYLMERINEDWDLLYLCKWLDRCDQYADYQQGSTRYLTVESPYPNGIQALVVSPVGRSKLQKLKPNNESELLLKIQERSLIAHSTIPNMFDISGDLSGSDAVKYFHCQTVYPPIRPDLAEPQVVSNLIQEINYIKPTASPIVPEEPPKTLTTRFTEINPRFFANILFVIYIIFFTVLIISSIKNLYVSKKNKSENVLVD